MSDDLTLYLERAARTIGDSDKGIGNVLSRVRAIIGMANMPPTEQGQLAQAALDAMRHMQRPTPQQLAALEYIIRLMRPAPLSRGGELDDLEPAFNEVFGEWSGFRQSVKRYL